MYITFVPKALTEVVTTSGVDLFLGVATILNHPLTTSMIDRIETETTLEIVDAEIFVVFAQTLFNLHSL